MLHKRNRSHLASPFQLVACGLLCLNFLATPAFAQRGGPPAVVDPGASIEITVKPIRNGSPDAQYAEIREHIVRSAGTTNAAFVVQVPGGPPVPPMEGMETLEMNDATGPVPVRGDSGGSRRWTAQRPITYPVTLMFKTRMWPPGTRTNPSYMLRSTEGGVSGQGSGILVTPLDGVDYPARYRWDMSDLAPGSITTSGITDDNDVRAPMSVLSMNFFMAGPLHRYPAKGDAEGFAAFWHGTPPWDAPKAMAWVASMYEYMRAFYKETAPRRYRVIGRMLPPPAYGGTALPGQFIFNAPAGPRDTSDLGPLLLLTHETGHLFVFGLQNPGGGGPSNNWFTEGLNEYYAITHALRSGLAPIDLVFNQLNLQTRNYYTNPRRTMPADSVARANPMTDGRAQNVSYERGTIFWGDVDARIRANTKNKRNLDNVIVPLIVRARTQGGQAGMGNMAREGGQPGWFTRDELVDSLAKAGGPEIRALFDSVIVRGKMMVPATNAFGPCFVLKPAKYADFYMGSNLTPPPADAKMMDGWLWERVKGVPDAKCRKW